MYAHINKKNNKIKLVAFTYLFQVKYSFPPAWFLLWCKMWHSLWMRDNYWATYEINWVYGKTFLYVLALILETVIYKGKNISFFQLVINFAFLSPFRLAFEAAVT